MNRCKVIGMLIATLLCLNVCYGQFQGAGVYSSAGYDAVVVVDNGDGTYDFGFYDREGGVAVMQDASQGFAEFFLEESDYFGSSTYVNSDPVGLSNGVADLSYVTPTSAPSQLSYTFVAEGPNAYFSGNIDGIAIGDPLFTPNSAESNFNDFLDTTLYLLDAGAATFTVPGFEAILGLFDFLDDFYSGNFFDDVGDDYGSFWSDNYWDEGGAWNT